MIFSYAQYTRNSQDVGARIATPNESINKLQSAELDALSKLWIEKKGELENSGEYQQFIKKCRENGLLKQALLKGCIHGIGVLLRS